MDYTRNFPQLYGTGPAVEARQRRRWERLLSEFRNKFGTKDPRLFSTPGRIEICGNHTDHNHGKVLAASIDLDSIAVAAETNDDAITLYSEQYSELFTIALNNLSAVDLERGTTAALIRGIAFRMQQLGYGVGGLSAVLTSDVFIGSGLSSSASVEVLIATLFNALYNDGAIEPIEIAHIAQYAENVYFDKPCGLMDQITCAVGGIIEIDFGNPRAPLIERIEFDFAREGYSVLVVDTGGNHTDLTAEYVSITHEMKSVAAFFGKEFCREISEQQLLGNIAQLRSQVGDRAFMRALHFVKEHKRAGLAANALRDREFSKFLRLIKESGDSSFRWLQNVYSSHSSYEQRIALALALSEQFIEQVGVGACRVHGGGFAGTIQLFLPHKNVSEYTKLMESAFTSGCVRQVNIRSDGAVELKKNNLMK